MKPTVAILAQGGMGSAVGALLVSNGLVVKTPLGGRSSASVARARAAGMQDASLPDIATCDIILSIVPPADALAAAQAIAPALSAARSRALFVDCNAISPETLQQVARAIAPTGCRFVDAGIIGLPPKPGGASPKFFASGDAVETFAALSQFGLDVRSIEGPIGAASTLKMCYGGITKGVIAVGAAMILAASKSGAAKALRDELQASQPNLIAAYTKSLPDMLPKAGRWVAEMEEISAFVGVDAAEGDIYAAFAAFYRCLAGDDAEAEKKAEMIHSFFARLR